MEKLHAVLNAYLRAELGATAAEASRVAPTTPLRKRGGGVRCVAVGFLLRRLGLGALLRQRRAELRAAVGPWQFAVGRPAAIETLVRELRHEVSRRTAPAVILFDCKNAFGEVPRRLIADQVIARVPELAAPIMMGIAGPTLGLVRLPGGGHAELESNHGVPQGSAEGPVAFALAMTAVVDDFRRELEAAIGAERAARVCLFAYLDDVTLVAEVEDAEAAIMAWRSALARAEFRESQGKTVVWTASGRPPPGAAASAAWAAAGRHDGFVLLGTAVAASAPTPAAAASGGVADAVAAVMAAHECDLPVPFGDDAFIQEFLATRLQHAAALASAVGELPGLAESGLPAMQAATALLRQCFMQRHAHLARTVPPELFRPFAQQLEDLALRAFEAALALPRLDGWRRAAVFEPLADGGVGLQPLADLTTAAFIGGRAAATAGEEEQREVRRGHRDADLERATADLRTQWGLDATAVLGCTTLALHLGGLRRAQRAVAVRVREVRTSRMRAGMSEQDRRWLDGASTRPDAAGVTSPGASDWLAAPLTSVRTCFSDAEWATLLRARLQLPLAAQGTGCGVVFASTSSTCSHPLEPAAWHAMGCAPAQRNHRHDAVRDELAAIGRSAGLQAEQEAQAVELPAPAPRRRPVTRRADVRVASAAHGPLTFVDVVITATPHETAGSWTVLPRGERVRAAEQDKVVQWDAAGWSTGSFAPRLVPFALESQGRWGPAAVAELRRWAKASVAYHGAGGLSDAAARSAVLRRWRVRISCAAARGLARMLLAALRPAPVVAVAADDPAAAFEEPRHLSLLF